jgi:glycerophosphoryl diester phosphodiesterase
MKNLLKIAHRGFSELYPENTMLAFNMAADYGADMIELDVHMSRDGRLVVVHDDTVDRTSDGSGLVKDLTLAELRELDFGRGHAVGGPVPIPLLEEVLETFSGRVILNIEIKNCPMQYQGIEAEIAKLIKGNGCTESVIVSSFDHYSLERLRRIDNSIKTGMLYSALWTCFCQEVISLGVIAVHPETSVFLPEQLEWVRSRGIKVFSWVVNDRETLKYLWGTGLADGIMVNDLRLFD